jgi:hypothetical protein
MNRLPQWHWVWPIGYLQRGFSPAAAISPGVLQALEHGFGHRAGLDVLLAARRDVAEVEEVTVPAELPICRVAKPAADTTNSSRPLSRVTVQHCSGV